jgi:hypothetical protein
MLLFCLTSYFIVFLMLEPRARSGTFDLRLANQNVWLAAFVLLSLLRYGLAYDTASHSIQMVVLVAGIVFGKAFGTWARWVGRRTPCAPDQYGWRNGAHGVTRPTLLLAILLILLAVSALWQPGSSMVFQYHGATRWNGVWDNPNLYGLLMGVGVVLAAGQIVRCLQFADGRRRKIFCVLLCFFAEIFCGIGLFKSYSRGAWLAVFAVLIYLAVQIFRFSRFSVWFCRNWFSLALLTISLLLLAFWQFRFVEQLPAQRLFSAANLNDFSWRNRMIAWEGAVRMMKDMPLAGFGWGQAEMAYGKQYCPPRLNNESGAIEMNDFLMIGISRRSTGHGLFHRLCGAFVAQKTSQYGFSIRHPPSAISDFYDLPCGPHRLAGRVLVRWRIVQTARCGCILDANGAVPC